MAPAELPAPAAPAAPAAGAIPRENVPRMTEAWEHPLEHPLPQMQHQQLMYEQQQQQGQQQQQQQQQQQAPAAPVVAIDGLQHHSDGEGAHEVEGGHMVESLAV